MDVTSKDTFQPIQMNYFNIAIYLLLMFLL